MTASSWSRTSTRPKGCARGARLAFVAALAAASAACSRGGDAADADPAAREPWPRRHLQHQALSILDEGRPPAGARPPAPRAITRIPGSRRLLGLLGGEGQLVVLDPSGDIIARGDAPPGSAALSFTRENTLLVAGEGGGAVARYRLEGDADSPSFQRLADLELDGASTLGALASAGRPGEPGWIFVADLAADAVLAARADYGEPARAIASCAGPHSLAVAGSHLVAGCGGEGAVIVWSLAADGTPSDAPRARIAHGDAIATVAARERWDPDGRRRRGLLIAAGGTSEATSPRGGRDSLVTVYGLEPGQSLERLAAVDVSRHGIVAPTWVDLVQGDEGSVRVDVIGYGGDRRAALTWRGKIDERAPAIETAAAVVGAADAVRHPPGLAVASPLLGGFAVELPELSFTASAPGGIDPRSPLIRVGEALAFSTLIGPPSAGETACLPCHGERDAVRADEPMRAAMDAFRDASGGAGDPWFGLDRDSIPWLAYIPGLPERMSPVYLRYALSTYLAHFEREMHPLAPLLREGAVPSARDTPIDVAAPPSEPVP